MDPVGRPAAVPPVAAGPPPPAPVPGRPSPADDTTPPPLASPSSPAVPMGVCETYTSPSGQPLLVCVRDAGPSWLDLLPAIAPPASVTVALFAIYAAHRLSITRQRRDERFKLCQTARDLVNEVAADASAAWRLAGDRDEAQSIASDVLGKFGRLGRQLEMLRGRDRRFDFESRLIVFRQVATTDIDDVDRPPSPERADEVQATAADLDAAIDRAFRTLHG